MHESTFSLLRKFVFTDSEGLCKLLHHVFWFPMIIRFSIELPCTGKRNMNDSWVFVWMSMVLTWIAAGLPTSRHPRGLPPAGNNWQLQERVLEGIDSQDTPETERVKWHKVIVTREENSSNHYKTRASLARVVAAEYLKISGKLRW